MRRALLVVLGCIVLAVGACSLLLPDEYVVNAPLLGTIFGADPPELAELRERVQLPGGFEIGFYAEGIRGARLLRFTSTGDLLVTAGRDGKVMLLEADRDGDGRADAVRTLVEGLNAPHGIDFLDDWLYVAETDAIVRVRYDAAARELRGELETVVPDLPSGGNHQTKTLRFGPDGWMYVSIGSTCNVCVEEDGRRAAMMRFRPDGSEGEVYATGLRNAVGFDFQPGTGDLYATDNGRDLLGDDFPPCELNLVVEGGFYGWPFANGTNVVDPDLGAGRHAEIGRAIPPAHEFVAHTAPLGIAFYRGDALPARYRGAAFVAQHGSWNRSEKSGYRVVALEWDAVARAFRESDFALGFELDEDVIGRPVDVAEGPDGALYVSDDFAGVVYRIAYGG